MSSDSFFLEPQAASTAVSRVVVDLAEHRMLAPARRAGVELQFLGTSPPPVHEEEHKLASGIWKFVNHVDDLTAREFGGQIPIPLEQIATLKRLHEVGVRPQHIWLAHQMPPDFRSGDPIPRLVPAPRELRETDERLTLRLAAVTRLFLKGAGIVLAAAATPGIAVAAAGAGLDPVILGGVEHPEQPLFGWCVLTQWEWE
jgi:hypothetical protein